MLSFFVLSFLFFNISGTGIRDYIHVVDLARGHVSAFDRIKKLGSIGCEVYNLGTGKGYSVKEMVAAFEKASNRKVCLVMEHEIEKLFLFCFDKLNIHANTYIYIYICKKS